MATIILNNLPTVIFSVSSPFGMRWHPIHNAWRMHNGIDLRPQHRNVPEPIFAATKGRILRNEWNNALGWFLVIEHVKGILFWKKRYQTWYQHLHVRSPLPVGTDVVAGQVIGTMGSSGDSTAVHLHFGVRDSSGQWIDPYPLLRNLQPIIDKIEENDDMIKYVTIADVPEWGRDAVIAVMSKDGIDGRKVLQGDEHGNINLTESMLRIIVMNWRVGLYS